MSMGSFAGFADTIDDKALLKYCRKEFMAFDRGLDRAGIDLDHFAADLVYDSDSLPESVAKLYDELQAAFNKRTGLQICLEYHDPENGDRYDEVVGAYWMVDGLWQLTPAGKKICKDVKRRFFTSFG